MSQIGPEKILATVLNSPDMLERVADRAREIDPSFPESGSSNALFIWLLLEQARVLIPFGATIPQVVATLMQPFPLGANSLLHGVGWVSFPPDQFLEKQGDIWVKLDGGIPVDAGLVAKVNPLGDFIYSVGAGCVANGYRPVRVQKSEINALIGST